MSESYPHAHDNRNKFSFDFCVEKLDYVQEKVHLVKRNLDVKIVPFKQILSIQVSEEINK
ncbi:hypothetical protein [Exiguobacterium sp. 9-2]|uniref:hypothetical protein n=1 Tax=Exiguobacterium sp. 9-2 TaxID=3112419 RepID=UPI002E2FD920|nr:hypothetical protein [Exiguobacterium sp. 9-2]